MKIECTFIPQAWVKDNAVDVDAEGPTTWTVESLEIVELTGVTNLNNMDDDPYQKDELRHAKSAPQWVKDWSGPFEIEWKVNGFQ